MLGVSPTREEREAETEKRTTQSGDNYLWFASFTLPTVIWSTEKLHIQQKPICTHISIARQADLCLMSLLKDTLHTLLKTSPHYAVQFVLRLNNAETNWKVYMETGCKKRLVARYSSCGLVSKNDLCWDSFFLWQVLNKWVQMSYLPIFREVD